MPLLEDSGWNACPNLQDVPALVIAGRVRQHQLALLSCGTKFLQGVNNIRSQHHTTGPDHSTTTCLSPWIVYGALLHGMCMEHMMTQR